MTNPDTRTQGRSVRKRIPRSSHGSWSPAPARPDPVETIEAQNADRLSWLVPVRRARMVASPFTFFRGSARIMAADLGAVPDTGLTVQLCGDAHLANFGVYASPERRLMFDVNDFDETLPGPFEWDVKRLAASMTIAGRHREFDSEVCRRLAVEATRAYRETMARMAERGWLEAWYSDVAFEELVDVAISRGLSKKQLKRIERFEKKAKSKDHLQAARKLVQEADGNYRFKYQPPLLVPLRDLPEAADPENRLREAVVKSFESYRVSLDDRMRRLLDRYQLLDVAVKVVGVGSVGTRCLVGLFLGRNRSDVLLLQIKEAGSSVLEEHLPESSYEHHGRRVVEGQRLMQATSDIFLGWSDSLSGRDYYWRQLKDWKGSADLEKGSSGGILRYGHLCGAILARAHAVTGDPAAIAGYLGKGEVFDEAMGDFAVRYAGQNDADYEAFVGAVREGRLEAAELAE